MTSAPQQRDSPSQDSHPSSAGINGTKRKLFRSIFIIADIQLLPSSFVVVVRRNKNTRWVRGNRNVAGYLETRAESEYQMSFKKEWSFKKDLYDQLRAIGVSTITLDLGRDNSDANPENIAMYCDKKSVYGDGPRRVFLNQKSQAPVYFLTQDTPPGPISDPVKSAWRYLKGIADAYEVWNADSEVQQKVVIDAKEGSITFSEN